MPDLPIIFSGPMVRALLDGCKTQTRRLATSPLRKCAAGDRLWVQESCNAEELYRPPYKRPTTALEKSRLERTSVIVCDELDGADGVRYLADSHWAIISNNSEASDSWFELFNYGLKDGERPLRRHGKQVPSIHMPRWASRLTLIVEAAAVEPLQAISEADAVREGVTLIEEATESPIDAFAALWDSLHTKPGERWQDNPDVVALTFGVRHGNIDRIAS